MLRTLLSGNPLLVLSEVLEIVTAKRVKGSNAKSMVAGMYLMKSSLSLVQKYGE